MKIAILSTVFVVGLGSAASAQTAEFKCPDKDITFVTRSDGVDDQTVTAGQQGDVCVSERTSGSNPLILRE